MALVTAQDYILASLRKLGQMRPGYVPSPELLAEILDDWGIFFDGLNSESTAQFTNPDYVYNVSGLGSQSQGNGYAIGQPFSMANCMVDSITVTVPNLQSYVLQIGMPVTDYSPSPGPALNPGTTIIAIDRVAGTVTLSQQARLNYTSFTMIAQPDWVGPRPESIIRANIVFSSGGQSPVHIPIVPLTQIEWANLAVRQITAINVTSYFWYDPQFPFGVFNVFPPLNGNQVEIFEQGVLAAPLALNQAYSAPPGYADVVLWGLAERNYYSMTKKEVIEKIPFALCSARAEEALEKVKRINRQIPTLRTDAPSGEFPADLYDSFVTYTGEPY